MLRAPLPPSPACRVQRRPATLRPCCPAASCAGLPSRERRRVRQRTHARGGAGTPAAASTRRCRLASAAAAPPAAAEAEAVLTYAGGCVRARFLFDRWGRVARMTSPDFLRRLPSGSFESGEWQVSGAMGWPGHGQWRWRRVVTARSAGAQLERPLCPLPPPPAARCRTLATCCSGEGAGAGRGCWGARRAGLPLPPCLRGSPAAPSRPAPAPPPEAGPRLPHPPTPALPPSPCCVPLPG